MPRPTDAWRARARPERDASACARSGLVALVDALAVAIAAVDVEVSASSSIATEAASSTEALVHQGRG